MRSKVKTTTKTAGLAGAGSGTGLIGLANLIPPQHEWARQIVLYAAPGFSFFIAWLWKLCDSAIKRRMRQGQVDKAVERAIAIRDRVMSDGVSSDAHKQRAQDNVEKLELLAMEINNDDTDTIVAILT